MYKLLFLSIAIIFYTNIQAQGVKSPIVIHKVCLGGEVYKYNGKTIKLRQIKEVVRDNDAAVYEIQKAKKFLLISRSIGAVGGLLAGIFAEGLAKGYTENTVPVLIGVVCLGVTFPLEKSYKQHTRKAIEIYNSSLVQQGWN